MGSGDPNPRISQWQRWNEWGLSGFCDSEYRLSATAGGSKDVVEFHGTLERLVCRKCTFRSAASPELLAPEVPHCPVCSGLLKPDFVFFGEAIPEEASERSFPPQPSLTP
jgi:NAD-dependent deacetylase